MYEDIDGDVDYKKIGNCEKSGEPITAFDDVEVGMLIRRIQKEGVKIPSDEEGAFRVAWVDYHGDRNIVAYDDCGHSCMLENIRGSYENAMWEVILEGVMKYRVVYGKSPDDPELKVSKDYYRGIKDFNQVYGFKKLIAGTAKYCFGKIK